MGAHFTGGLLLLLQATAAREPIPAPGERRRGPTDRGTRGAGNRTRDLPPHGLTAYHLRHQGRKNKLGFFKRLHTLFKYVQPYTSAYGISRYTYGTIIRFHLREPE